MEMFLRKPRGVEATLQRCSWEKLIICSKFTGKHLSRSVISTKMQNNFIEVGLQHGCSPVNLQHIFRTLFPKIISGALLLVVDFTSSEGLGQHCVKSVRIRSYSGPYLSVFCPNAGTYGPNNSEYGHFLRSADM